MVSVLTQPTTALIPSWKNDLRDYERHTLFAAERRKAIHEKAPTLSNYIPQMRDFLLNLQQSIYQATWFRIYSEPFKMIKQVLGKQNINNLSVHQLIGLIKQVYSVFAAISFDQISHWEHKFFSDHLIELEKISHDLFNNPDYGPHAKQITIVAITPHP